MVKGNINAQKYIEILDNNIWPLAVRHFPVNDYVFQDDNAPGRQARIVQEFMDENQIVHMDWPAQCPNLNIIKNVCLKIKPHFFSLFAFLIYH